jgi:ankyrin repeat protein
MLQSIDSEYQKQVSSVLKWLAFSLRPLFLEELAEIFILDHEKAVPFDESDRLFSIEEVLTYLPGLVTQVPIARYDDYSSIRHDTYVTEIKFAHFSIKEYLSSSRIRREDYSTAEQATHLHISECCLAYHLQLSETILATELYLERYSLWEYAAQYLPDHLEKVALEYSTISVTHRAKRAFATQSQSLLNIVRISSDKRGSKWTQRPDELRSPLYYVASMGAFQLTSLLIHNGADINEVPPSASDDTVLQEAIYKKHKAIVKLLLEHGADINAQGGWYGNALQEAGMAGDREVVQLLIRTGAQVNAEGGYYGTALQAATFLGHLNILQLFLDSGADVNVRLGVYGNALQAAVAGDELDIAELLLTQGANVDPPGVEWEQLITEVTRVEGNDETDRLRKFQENPTGYIEMRRRELQEEERARAIIFAEIIMKPPQRHQMRTET